MTHKVWRTKDNWLFSDGVSRDFGQNRMIQIKNSDEAVLASVMPLKIDPIEHDMELFGFIQSEEPADND